jgi:hypothetical protein
VLRFQSMFIKPCFLICLLINEFPAKQGTYLESMHWIPFLGVNNLVLRQSSNIELLGIKVSDYIRQFTDDDALAEKPFSLNVKLMKAGDREVDV